MYYQNSANTYKSMEVTSSNKLKIIIMVYDAAIASLKEAVETHQRNDLQKRNQYISRTQYILLELNNALDMQSGKSIAENLRNLYHFLNRYLGEVLSDNDIGKVRNSLRMLQSLPDSWQAISQDAATRPAEHGAAVYHGGSSADNPRTSALG